MLIAYEAAVRPTATTVLGEHDAVRPEAEHPCINAYDAAHLGYDGPSNALIGAGTGAAHPYDDDPEKASPSATASPYPRPYSGRTASTLAP
jgi:hypothetical protein